MRTDQELSYMGSGKDRWLRRGFVFVVDSPAQIAAREKAASDAQMRASGYALGQALIQAGQAMQPHYCNGMVMPAGNFNMQCN